MTTNPGLSLVPAQQCVPPSMDAHGVPSGVTVSAHEAEERRDDLPLPLLPSSTAEAEATKSPRNGKIAKIKRKENSFRPGSSIAQPAAKPSGLVKRLVFTIPSASSLSSPEEAGEIQRIATSLANHELHGSVTSLSLENATWEIVFTMNTGVTTDEDEFLSDVFRELMPTISSLPGLCNGFRNGAMSSWEYRVGANVLDGGSLN